MLPDFDIADDVRAELEDDEYSTRQHYSRATYALGCHGPLCGLKETHRGRERNQARAEAAGREYRPALGIRKIEREEELMRVVQWHLEQQRQKARAVPVAAAS